MVEQAAKSDEITRWYYLTGGTALAEFYLHHRLSEDIDLFTRDQVDHQEVQAFLRSIQQKAGFLNVTLQKIGGLYQYWLEYSDGERLKIDFNEYDFPLIEQGVQFGKLQIDSKYDIAINKLESICSRSKARDFVDLYMLLEQKEFSLEQLAARIPDKFSIWLTDLTIIRGFLAVQEVKDYPTMLIPFDRQKMIDFYLAEAKKLEKKIFK